MIRVGAVNYLNTKPLIEGLEGFAPTIRLTLDLPSRLADQMARHELDVGLLPVAEVFRGGYAFLPNMAIASRGAVLSVTLFSKVPWESIRSVALDEGSRTSAMLTKVLLSESRGTASPGVKYEQLPIDADADAVETDAVLLIGDRAMKACLPKFTYSYDLGQLWHDRTGLPMVFAVWAVRPGVEVGEAEAAFEKAKRHGLARSGEIAARESKLLGLDPGYVRRYFDTIIQYDLGPRELAGLKRFRELALECGFIPESGGTASPCQPLTGGRRPPAL
jgi:chorismate dehydratase